MSVPREIQDYLDKQEFDAVEDAWLSHLEENPHDLPFFSSVGRALQRAGEDDRARFLLEMVDEHLRDAADWQRRLELIRASGAVYVPSGELHGAILESLRQLFGERPSCEQMIEKVGLLRAVDDIPKTWKKADRLAGLLAFDIGSIVHLEGKGAGRVTEVNMALESFKVELDDHGDIRVGFGGAAKLLKPISKDHVLRRKLENRAELERLRDQDPSELLRLVLTSYDEPRTGAEVRRDLAGLVADKSWSSWWTAARKHPQVLASSDRRRAYGWAASSDDAQGAVWQAFEAADARARIGLLRQNASRDAGLKDRMSEALAAHAAGAVDEDPGLVCEIYFNLERYGTLPSDVMWAPSTLAAQVSNKEFLAMSAGIQDRAQRERIYGLGQKKRPDWAELAVNLLWQENDSRALDTLFTGLGEAEGSLFDQILSQPRKNPAAFAWLVDRAKDRPEWLGRNPLRLMRQLLWAMTHGEFGSYKSRFLELCESGGTVPRLLSHLSEDHAPQAAESLKKTSALVDYQREPLLNALYLRFPSLREEDAAFYATPAAIQRKHEEMRKLIQEEIPTNRKAIEVAREMGDLRENFEYKSARDRHEYLSAIATTLDNDLHRVRPIDPSTVDGKEVVIGSRLRLVGDNGETTLTILGPWDSKPEENILSNESEFARSILGKKKGDSLDFEGGTYTIEAIEPWS